MRDSQDYSAPFGIRSMRQRNTMRILSHREGGRFRSRPLSSEKVRPVQLALYIFITDAPSPAVQGESMVLSLALHRIPLEL